MHPIFERLDGLLHAQTFEPFVIVSRYGCFQIRHPGQVALQLLAGKELIGIAPALLPGECPRSDLLAVCYSSGFHYNFSDVIRVLIFSEDQADVSIKCDLLAEFSLCDIQQIAAASEE